MITFTASARAPLDSLLVGTAEIGASEIQRAGLDVSADCSPGDELAITESLLIRDTDGVDHWYGRYGPAWVDGQTLYQEIAHLEPGQRYTLVLAWRNRTRRPGTVCERRVLVNCPNPS